MKRKSSFKRIGLAFILLLLSIAVHVQAQDTGRSWAIKSGVGGIFTGHLTGEAEVFLKGRVSFALRGALIRPNMDPHRGPAEGFYFKAGPKFYLSKTKASELSGFALKPELSWGHQRDWTTNVRGNFGNRWVNSYGLTCNLSHNILLFDRLIVEPSLGIGYVAQFESLLLYDDQPPFAAWRLPYSLVYAAERKGYEHSQWSLAGGFCVTGGILVGIRF